MIPKYLEGKVLPRHLQVAFGLFGTKEIVGKANNATIMSWAKELDIDDIYTNCKK